MQHCKLLSADFSPPYRFIRRRRGYGGLVCLWAFSFHFQFHDLRVVLESGDFGGGEAGCVRDLLVGKIHGL